MTQQTADRQDRAVILEDITDANWRDVADVAPADDQRRFVAALGARYLLLSTRGGVWNSLAVRAGDEVVGHAAVRALFQGGRSSRLEMSGNEVRENGRRP
ncbi:hypothetical protein [Streptomyces prasinus]|uniref:hypothetical protein n=1 Tax=Streptomyces prasinus TaxID=67345 RepID=UPI003643FF3F